MLSLSFFPQNRDAPYRTWTRHNKADRSFPPPTYSGLVFSDDLPDDPHHRVSASWVDNDAGYNYTLYEKSEARWCIKTHIVEPEIDRMLLERLKATTIDEVAWQQVLESMQYGERVESRRVEASIREAKRAQDNLVSSLTMLNNPELIRRAEARYEALSREIAMLTAEIDHQDADQRHETALVQARPALEKLIERWEDVPRQERRSLFEAFAHYANLHGIDRNYKLLTIYWRDGSTSECKACSDLRRNWTTEDLETLRQMVEGNVDQIEILKVFPNHTWRALQMCYSYHFTENHHWPRKTYAGKISYPHLTRWADTQEAQQDLENAETTASYSQIKQERHSFAFFPPGRWLFSA